MTSLEHVDFQRQCSIEGPPSLADSSSSSPNSSLSKYGGYGDAAPDSISTNNKYGYDADATPDNSSSKYGYGDTSKESNPYGYGDAKESNPYGYGEASPDSSNPYGYGDTSKEESSSNPYGYGDTPSDSNPYGYGDDSQAPQPQANPRRRSGGRRPRRRGSVTKYSIDAQDTVQKEYEEAAARIQQLRSGAKQQEPPVALPPPPPPAVVVSAVPDYLEPLAATKDDGDDDKDALNESGMNMSLASDDNMSQDLEPPTRKKSGRFGRFRIGRNSSGMSISSRGSTGSRD